MEEIYENQVCINCKTDKCRKSIKIIKKQDIFDGQLITITTIKCDNFNVKNNCKRRKSNEKVDKAKS